MVPGDRRPLTAVRRQVAAFIVVAALIWWIARRDDLFYVVGLDNPISSALGPVLTALCAGATVALIMSLAEAGSGATAGVIALVTTVLLPGFFPLHRSSLVGPPLLALTVFTLGVMLHAPRFSFAYGGLAACAALFVSPAGLGLPLAASAWAYLHAHRRGRRRWRRFALALLPVFVGLIVMRWSGSDAWSGPVDLGWRGGLDRALRAAGRVIGDQLAPGLSEGALRWFVIADGALIALAVVAVAWRRVVAPMAPNSLVRRFYEASAVLVSAYMVGLAVRTMLIVGAPDPDAAAVFPIAVVAGLVLVVSCVQLWPRWSRPGRVIALLLGAAWASAAIVLT